VVLTPGSGSFQAELAGLSTLAARPFDNASELSAVLGQIYQAFADSDFDRFDLEMLKRTAPDLIRALFDFRLALREKVPEWHGKGFLSLDTQRKLRDVFRVTRYAGDMLGEIAGSHDRLAEGATTFPAFSGGQSWRLVNAKMHAGGELEFRSGDVIMMRGMAHNSAAIARIGDIDSQFSHIGLVHVDDKGKRWVVEALIEEGAVVTPLEDCMAHGLGRAVLLRPKDQELAARASAFMFKRVKRSRGWFGRTILYDFTMDPSSGYKELFCSKLLRQGYDAASEGIVMLPTFTTRLDMRNRDFFKRIGVTAQETFAPGDMEIEPRFDGVAEWRDFRVTSDLRLQDLVMAKFFEWMEVYDYKFRETFVIYLISLLGRMSAHFSETAKDLIEEVVPKVPVNMRRKTIAAIAMLHKTAQPVFEELRQLELARIARTGSPMHPREAFVALEAIRARTLGELGYLAGRPEPLPLSAEAAHARLVSD